MPSVRILVTALAAVLWLVLTPAAHADGDPASDVLVQQDVFYGSALDLESKPAAQLPALLAQASQKGYEIRVAAISRFADLGTAGSMWEVPKAYAKFLGEELSLVYGGRLMIVMPNGYALFHLGHSTVREQRLLGRLAAPRRAERFLPGAIDAVERLAAAEGVKLSVPEVEPPPGGVPAVDPIHAAPPAASVTTAPGATVTPRSGPARAPAAASGGSSGAWLFVLPVAAFVLVAVVAIVRGRVRDRRSSPT
ncbi:hypothetical protein [Candidatus Solirubrobacter pratensis]|uniref:hypothetical protein n=1 Tax=Candidatus Solirubrobacter pratensis TaxID=1298857 RepID=UPI000428604B|nr:hypothetical protein [Candidatus Solirubrobacter pratensis]